MNHLHTAFTWLGAASALGCLTTIAWALAVNAADTRRINAKRAALRTARKPLTEADIRNVDFNAELANLTKENGR